MALDGAKFICLSDAAAEDAAPNETTPATADAGKVAGNGAEATSAEQNTVIEAKGRKFTVGYYMSCDYVLDDSRAEGVHCEIQCDAFGRVTIHNISEAHPISVNGQIISLKRPLLDGSRIKILDRHFLWKFPKSVEVTEGTSNEDETSTPLKGVAPEQAPNSCPDLKPHRKVDKRFTVHNFAYCINSDEEGNTSTELPSINESESVEEEATTSAEEATDKKEESEQTESEAAKQREMSTNNASQDIVDDAKATSSERRSITPEPQPHTSTNKLAASTPILTLDDTPKSNLINCTQNKENKSSEKNRRLISLCQQSDVVITSFSPRETGVRIEKSFTAIFKPITAAAATTPKSVYSTPKSLISDYNDENSRDFIDFTTPATSKKTFGARALARNSSMHLIDLTTPNKLAPASTRSRNTGATALKRNQTLPTNVKLSTTPLIYEKLEVDADNEDDLERGIKALPVTPKVDVTSTDTSTPQSAELVISVDGSSSDSSTTPVIEISTEDSATPSISSPVRTNIKPQTKTPQRAVVTGQKQQLTSTPQRTQTPSLMKRALLTSAKKNANPTNRASPARPPHTPSTPIARNTAAGATSSTPKSSGRLAIGSPSGVAAAQRRNLSVKPRLSLAAIDSCSPAVRKGAITTSTPLNPRHTQARNVAASAPRLSMVKRTSPLRGVRKSIGGVTLNSHISKARRSVVSPKKRSPTAIVAQHVSKARRTLCIANANKSQIASRSRSLVLAAVSATSSSKPQHGIGEKTKPAHAPPKTTTTTAETDLSRTFTKEDDESFKELPDEEKNIKDAVEEKAKNITFSPVKQDTTKAETTQQELNKTFSPEKVVKELEEVTEIKQEDLSVVVLNEKIDEERKAESFAKVVESHEKSAGVEVAKAPVSIVPEAQQQSLEISTSALALKETTDAVQESIQNENTNSNTEVIETENKKTPTVQVEGDEAQPNVNVSTAQAVEETRVNDEVVSSRVLDTQPENKTADELPPADVEAIAAKPTGESQGTADLLEEIEYVLNKSDELKQQLSDREAHNTSDTKMELENNETDTEGGITVEESTKVVNLESTEQNNMNGDDVDCLPANASATELPSTSKIIFSVKSNLEQKEEEDDKTSIDSDVLEATFDIGASSDIDAGSMKTEILSITTNTTPSEFEVSSFGGSSVEKDFTSEKSTVTLDAEENVQLRTDIEMEKTTATDLANSKSTTVEEAESTTGEVESTAAKRNVGKAPDSTKISKTENTEIVEEKEAAATEKEAIETLDIKETQTKLQETADKNQVVAAELHKVAQPEEAVIEPLTIDESFAMDTKVTTTDKEEIVEEAKIESEVSAKEANNSGSKKVDEANSKSAKDETTLQVTLATTELGESKPIEVETTGEDKPINSDDEKENRKVVATEMPNSSTIIVADSKTTALEPKTPNLTGIRDMLRTPKQHSVGVAPITPRSIGLRSLMRTPKASTSAAAAAVTTIAEGDDDDEEEMVSELPILPKTPQQSKRRAQTPQSAVEVANNLTPRRSARRRASANPDLTPTRCLTPTLDTNTDMSTPRRTSRRRASASAEVSYTPKRITKRRSSLSLDNEEAIAAALTPQKRGGSGLRAKRTTSTLILECAAAEDMGAIIEEEPKEDAEELNDSKQNIEDVKDTKSVDLKSIVPSISDVIEESICEEINTQKGQPNEPKDNLIEEEKVEGEQRAVSNIEASVSMPPAKLKEVENEDKEEQERDLAGNPIIDAEEIDVIAAEIKDTIEELKPQSESLTTDEDVQKIESKVLDKSDYEYGKEVAQEGADISTLEEQPKTPKSHRKSVRIVDNALNSPKTPVMVGMRELMKTPKTTDHTPKLIGVRDLMRTPKVATGLTGTDDADEEANFTGLADLVKTPKVDKVTEKNGNKEIVEKNAKDNEKREEPSTSTEARTAFIGMRELLKTPKHKSTPQYRGMRELLRTPKACSTPQLGGLEELMQTPKRTKLNDKYEDDDDDDDNEGLDQFFKTPRAKHVMIPGDPASAILEPSTDASSLNIMTATTEYDLHSSHHRALEDIYKTPVSSRLSDVDTLTEYNEESDAKQKKDEDSEIIVPETPAQTINATTTKRNIAAEEAFDEFVDEQTPQKVITRKSQLASGLATASLLSPFSATDVITDLPKTDIQEWVDNLQQSDELDVEAEEEREVSVSTSILNAAKDATHDPIAASVCETSNLTVNKDTTEQMLADMSAITTSDDPLLPSASKHATAQNENETLRPATPNEADISGINLLDQTNESVFSEPLVVSDIESLHSQENEQIVTKESSTEITDRQRIISEVAENKSQDEEDFPSMFVESSESEHEDDGVVTKTATEIAGTTATPAQKVTESQEKTIAENKTQDDTVIIDLDDSNTAKPVQSATTSSTTQSTNEADIHIEFSNFQAHKTIASQQMRASTPNRSTKARTTKHEQARRRQSMGAEKQLSSSTIDLTEEKSRLVKEKTQHTTTADCIIEVDESIEESIAIEYVTKDEETPAGINENAAELNAKEAELKEESAELKEKAAELSEKEAELKEAAELKEKEAELKEEAAELKEKAAELSEHIDDLKEAELKEKAAELNQNAAELSETVSKLDEKVDVLKENANEAELSKNVPELTENAAELNENAAELNEDAAELNENAAELNESADELNKAKANTNAAKLPSKSQETKALSTEQIREEFGNFQAHKTIASRGKRAATPDQVNKKMAHKISQAPRRLTLGAEQHLTAVNIDFVKDTSQSQQSKQLPERIIEIDDSIEEAADEQVSAPQFKQSDGNTSEGTVIMVEMTKTNTTLKANKEIVEETQKEFATQETIRLDNASEQQNTTEGILEASANEENIEKVVEHHIPEEPATKVTESDVKEKTSEVALSTQTTTAKNDSPPAAKTEFNESDIFDLTEEVPNDQPAVNTTQGVIFDLTAEEEVKKVQNNEKSDAEENIFEVTDNEENNTQSQSESSNDRRVECQSDAISSTAHDTATAAIQLEKAGESGNDVAMVASNDEVKADSTNDINDVANDKRIGDKTAADLQKEGNEELVLKTSMVSEEDNIDISESINKMSQAKVDDINIAVTEGSNNVDKDNANDKESNVPLPDKAEESDQITAEPPALLLQDSVNELDADIEEITAENKIVTSMEADTTLSVNESDQGKVAETENEAPTNVEQIKEVIDEDTQQSNKVAVEANAEMPFEVQSSAQEVVDEMNIVTEKQNEEKEVHSQTPANENCVDVEEVNKTASSSKKQTPAKRSQRKPSHTKQLNEQAETATVNEVIVEESERNLDKVEENTKSYLLTPLKEQTTENTTKTDAELVGDSEELTVTSEGVPAITKEVPQTLEDKSVSSSDDISTISEGKLANTEEGNAKTEEQPAKSEEKLDSSESGNASSENVIVSSTELQSSVDKKPASSEQDVICNAEEVAPIAEEKTARTEDVLRKTDENVDKLEEKASSSTASVEKEQPAKRSKRKTSRSKQSSDENAEVNSKATIETDVIVGESGTVPESSDGLGTKEKISENNMDVSKREADKKEEDMTVQEDQNVDTELKTTIVVEVENEEVSEQEKQEPAKRSKRKTSRSKQSSDENAEIISKATIETEVIVEESEEVVISSNPDKEPTSSEEISSNGEEVTPEDVPAQTNENVDKLKEKASSSTTDIETEQPAKRSRRKTSRSKQSTDENTEIISKATIETEVIVEESETVQESSDGLGTKEKISENNMDVSKREADQKEEDMTVQEDQNVDTELKTTIVVEVENKEASEQEKQEPAKRSKRKTSRSKQSSDENAEIINKATIETEVILEESEVVVISSNPDKEPTSSVEISSNGEEVTPEDVPAQTNENVDKLKEKASSSTTDIETEQPAKRSRRKTSRSKQSTDENTEIISKATIETDVIVEESETVQESSDGLGTKEKISENNMDVSKREADKKEEDMTVQEDQNVDTELETKIVVEVENKEASEQEKQEPAKRSKRKTSRSKQSTDENKEAVKANIETDLIIEESETVEEESEECVTKEKNVEESTKVSNEEISTVPPQAVDELNEATTSDEKQPAGKRKVHKPSRTKQTEVEEDNEKNTTHENKTLVEEVITTQENQVGDTETQITVDEEENQEPAKRSKRKTSRSKQTTVENKETDSKATIETDVIIEESETIEKSHEPIAEEKTSEINVKVTTKVSNEISTVPPQSVDELSEATTSDEKQPADKRKVRKPSRTKQTAVEVDDSEEKTANENKSSVEEKTIAHPENQDAEAETLTTVLAEAVETETTTEKELKLPEKRTVRKTSRSKQKVEQKEEETATTVEETKHLDTVTEVPIEDTEIAKPLTTKLDDEAKIAATKTEEQLTDATTEKIEETVETTTSVPAKRKGRKPSRTKQIAEEKLLKDNNVPVEEQERDAEKASVDIDAKAALIAEQANAADVVEVESSRGPSTLHVKATYEVCLLTDSEKANKSAPADKTSELVLSSNSSKESTADKTKLSADQESDTTSNVVDEAESTDKQEEEEAHTQRPTRRTRKGSATSQCSTQDEDHLPTTKTKRRAGRRRAETPIENSADEASHVHDEAPTTTKRRRGQAKAAPEISQLEEIKEVLVADSEQVKEQADANEKKIQNKNETEKVNEKKETVTEEGTEQANHQLAAEVPKSVEIEEDVSETKPKVSAAKVSKTEISDEVKEVVATAVTANAAEQEIKDGNSEESKVNSKAPTRRGGRRKPTVSESSPTSNSTEHVEVNAMQRGRRRRKPTTEEPAVSAGETKTTPTAEASEEILPTVLNKITEDKSTEKCSDTLDVKGIKAEMKKDAVEEPHASSSSSKTTTKRALKEKKEEAPVIPAITIESPEEVGDLKSESQKENIAVTEKEQPDEESTSAGRKRANRRNKAEASEEPQTENDDDTTHHKEKEKGVHTKTRKVVEESTSTPTAADSVGGRRGRRGAAAAATVAINEVASAHKRGTPRAKSQQNTSQSQTSQREETTKKTNTAQREETTKKTNNAEAPVSPREDEQKQKDGRRKRRGSATVGDTEKEQQHESEDEPTTTKKVTKSVRKRHESLHTTEAEDTHAEDTSATKQRSRRKRKNSLQSVNNDEVTRAAIGSAGDAGNDEPPKKQPLSRKRRDSSLDSSIHESAAADVDGGDNKASGGNTSSASTTPNRSRNIPRRAVAAEERNYDESSDAEAQVELKRRIEKAALPKGSSSAAAAAATKSIEAAMTTTTSKPELKDKSARNTPILAAVLTTSRGGRQRKPTARVQQYLEEERAKAETPKKRLLLSSAAGGSAETSSTSQTRSTPAKRTRKASAVESETSEAPHTPARGGRARNLKKIASTATETSEESRSEVDHLHSEHETTTQSTTVVEEKAATSKVGKRVATRRGKEIVSTAAAPTESESEAPSATTTQTVHAGRSGRAAKAAATAALITDDQTPSSSQTKPRGVGAKRARRGAHADTAATDDEQHTDVETKDAEDEKKSKKTTKATTDGGAAAGRVARAGRGGRRKNSVDDSATSSGDTKQQALVVDADDEHEEEDDDVILMNYVDHEEDNNEDGDRPIEKVKKTTAATKKRTANVGGSAAKVTESPAPKRVRRHGGDEKDASATQTDTSAASGSRKAVRSDAVSGSSGTATATAPTTRATRSRRK